MPIYLYTKANNCYSIKMNYLKFWMFLSAIGLSLGFSQHTSSQESGSLTLNLYYESLCPDCQEFSSEQLCPVWQQMGDNFLIEFVPYGNAETNVSASGEITINCQHGSTECDGDRIQSCALKHLSYTQSTKFICCMESAKKFDTAGPDCASKLGIDYNLIKLCADGDEGNQLHYLNGVKTSKLQPEHEWVPWILFNGKYSKEDMDQAQDDLVSVLCKYIKDPKPRECNEIY